MSKLFKVTVPFVDDMGSVSPLTVKETQMESKAKGALWDLNRIRDYDGLPHLNRMPNGTKYEAVKGKKDAAPIFAPLNIHGSKPSMR